MHVRISVEKNVSAVSRMAKPAVIKIKKDKREVSLILILKYLIKIYKRTPGLVNIKILEMYNLVTYPNQSTNTAFV